MKFDSKAEAKAAPFLASLGFIRYDHNFECGFEDSEGKQFNARPDFYHEGLDLYLELKPAKLNKKQTKRTADAAMAKMDTRYVKNVNFYQITHQWNHSCVKQTIVQTKLTPGNFVVCFTDPIEVEDLAYYCKKGLAPCTLNSLKSFIGFVLLRKIAGFKASFTLSSPDGAGYTLS